MVKLTPPPRTPSIRPPGEPRSDWNRTRHGSPPSRLLVWGTAVLFAMLAVLAVVVFYLLPGWVGSPTTAPRASMPAVPSPTVIPEPTAEVPTATDPRSRNADGVQGPPARGRLAPESGDAADGPNRTDRQHAAARFNDAMTEGLAALEAGNPSEARRAFERAGSIRPSSPEVAEGIRRVDRLQRRRRIAALRDRAAAAETGEDWRSAEQAYADVLAIDQHLAFAQQGLERSALRRQLADSIEFHLAHPERLVSDDVLAEAEMVLERAREAEPNGARLDDLISRLSKLVEVSSTPVTLSLHSDNHTHVVIYRVGELGTFARTTVQLRPGTYTVVGSRPGYRDVRLEVTVRPGGPVPPLVIRCEEEV